MATSLAPRVALSVTTSLSLSLSLAGCGAQGHSVEAAAPAHGATIVMKTTIAELEAVAPKAAVHAAAPASPLSPLADIFEVALAGHAFGPEIRSVRFVSATVLRKEPRAEAGEVGVIGKGARAAIAEVLPAGDGCRRRWIRIEPRGWACETAIAPSREAPTAAEPVSLTDDDAGAPPPVRGLYGIVRGKGVEAYETAEEAEAGENGRLLAGSNTVRAAGVVTVDGRRFWRTTGGDLIDASSISVIGTGSRWKGIALAPGDALPAWARSHKDPRKPVVVRAEPSASAGATGSLAPRAVVSIEEQSADGRFARIGEGAWVERADLRVATLAEPPPGTGADERWFDVDLDEQVLVAYEGARPVYATLISTGKPGHATPARIARVARKLQSTTMTSTQREKYSVADVPWTMFYDGNYALHASYWHDGFGGTRSHGCINLAPRDARLLFRWSSPDVPPGWIAVYGDEDHPGSLVRVRSRRVPDPSFHGYARTLREK